MGHSLRIALLATLVLFCSCASDGYLAQRGRDLADVFTVAGTAGLEASADVQATDLVHLAVGAGVHAEAGMVGRRLGTASVLTLGLPVAPFLEDGVLYGRYVFSETGGAWRTDDVEDECYLVHLIDAPPTHPSSDAWHALDLEVGATVLVGGRLGLSPGELLDFLAGLVGLDPIGDDVSEVAP